MEIVCYACGKGEYPENTLEAITHCQKVNPEWRIEMDLQLTSDDEVVLFHDDNLKRTTGFSKNINEMTYEQVKTFNVARNFELKGTFPFKNKTINIPLLVTVLKQFPKAKFVLDIHSDNLIIVKEVIKIIETIGVIENVVIVSKHHHILKEFRKKRPRLKYGASTKEVKQLVISSLLRLESLTRIKSNILMLPVIYKSHRILTDRIISFAKKNNKKLWVWIHEGKNVVTVNSMIQFNLLRNKKVDGVFTSFPEKLSEDIGLRKLL